MSKWWLILAAVAAGVVHATPPAASSTWSEVIITGRELGHYPEDRSAVTFTAPVEYVQWPPFEGVPASVSTRCKENIAQAKRDGASLVVCIKVDR